MFHFSRAWITALASEVKLYTDKPSDACAACGMKLSEGAQLSDLHLSKELPSVMDNLRAALIVFNNDTGKPEMLCLVCAGLVGMACFQVGFTR